MCLARTLVALLICCQATRLSDSIAAENEVKRRRKTKKTHEEVPGIVGAAAAAGSGPVGKIRTVHDVPVRAEQVGGASGSGSSASLVPPPPPLPPPPENPPDEDGAATSAKPLGPSLQSPDPVAAAAAATGETGDQASGSSHGAAGCCAAHEIVDAYDSNAEGDDDDKLRTSKMTWTFKHSLVSTMSLSWLEGDGSRYHEQVMIPPTCVSSTKAPVLGLALLESLERFVFGKPVQSWLRDLATSCRALLMVFAGDCASANIRLMRLLRCLLHAACRNLDMVLLFWWEPCGLHQATKGSLSLLHKHKLVMPLYSLGKIHRMKKHREEMMKAMRRIVETLEYRPYDPTFQRPSTGGYSAELRAELVRLTVDPWAFVQAELAQAQERADGPQDRPKNKNTLKRAVEQYFEFFNMDLCAAGPPGHTCVKLGCCRDRDHAVDKGFKHTLNVSFFSGGGADFEPGRFLRQVPALQYWCRLAAVNNIAGKMLQTEFFKPDQMAKDLAGDRAAIQELLKKRITKGRQRLNEKNVVFHLMLNLVMLYLLEKVPVRSNCAMLHGAGRLCVPSALGEARSLRRC